MTPVLLALESGEADALSGFAATEKVFEGNIQIPECILEGTLIRLLQPLKFLLELGEFLVLLKASNAASFFFV